MTNVSPTFTTRVRLRELSLLAEVGINPEEIGCKQPLIIGVELRLGMSRIETIGDTVDYRRIADAAHQLASSHIPLIETFAYRLGEECVSWDGVMEARVTIDKPFALPRGLAGVEVLVERQPLAVVAAA